LFAAKDAEGTSVVPSSMSSILAAIEEEVTVNEPDISAAS